MDIREVYDFDKEKDDRQTISAKQNENKRAVVNEKDAILKDEVGSYVMGGLQERLFFINNLNEEIYVLERKIAHKEKLFVKTLVRDFDRSVVLLLLERFGVNSYKSMVDSTRHIKLSVRAGRVLGAFCIRNIGEFLSITKKDVLSIRGCGETTFSEIYREQLMFRSKGYEPEAYDVDI